MCKSRKHEHIFASLNERLHILSGQQLRAFSVRTCPPESTTELSAIKPNKPVTASSKRHCISDHVFGSVEMWRKHQICPIVVSVAAVRYLKPPGGRAHSPIVPGVICLHEF